MGNQKFFSANEINSDEILASPKIRISLTTEAGIFIFSRASSFFINIKVLDLASRERKSLLIVKVDLSEIK